MYVGMDKLGRFQKAFTLKLWKLTINHIISG